MPTLLPPFHTLTAFEAAARLGGFRQAAESLYRTPSSISHSIRELEAHLGKALFVRRHRGVTLTADGQRYYAVVHDALQRLLDATEALCETERHTLRLSVAPAIGGKWLVGRLDAYRSAHPDIEFELATATDLGPLLSGEADLGLRYGEEDWPGLEAWKLFDETLVAVCSPAFRTGLGEAPAIAALPGDRLLRHPLLSWAKWFAAAGLAGPEAAGPLYKDGLLMLEATAAGQGVALMTHTLAVPYLQSGSLVQLSPFACPDRAFYAVAARDAAAKPWVAEFIRWLARTARAD